MTERCNCDGQPSAVCVCDVERSGNCRVSASVVTGYSLCRLIVLRHTLNSDGLTVGRSLRTHPQSLCLTL